MNLAQDMLYLIEKPSSGKFHSGACIWGTTLLSRYAEGVIYPAAADPEIYPASNFYFRHYFKGYLIFDLIASGPSIFIRSRYFLIGSLPRQELSRYAGYLYIANSSKLCRAYTFVQYSKYLAAVSIADCGPKDFNLIAPFTFTFQILNVKINVTFNLGLFFVLTLIAIVWIGTFKYLMLYSFSLV